MAASKRFIIPSLDEMENADTSEKQVPESLFKRRKEFESPDAESSRFPARLQDNDSSLKTTAWKAKGQSSKTTNDSVGVPQPSTNSFSTAVSIARLHSEETVDSNTKYSTSNSRNVVSNDSLPAVSETSNGIAEAQKGSLTGSKPGSSNSLIVNTRQRGNPILKSVRNIPWEYGNIVPDYVMGQANCALFLSLRYHQLHPNYIHERLKLLGRSYDLRVMLVQVDVKEPHHLLKDLAKICLLADCTLILSFSPEEAGRYLETYKIFENKPPEAIMEKTEENFMAKFTDCLTRVKSVNKTDCATLISHFGSLANVMDATEEDLSLCPGFGPQKAKRLHDMFHEPFLRSNVKGGQKEKTDIGLPSDAR